MRQKFLFLILSVLLIKVSNAQISVSATLGTTSGSYTTLKASFDAINAGTHKGVISITVSANTTEGTAAIVLNASGSGSASYTSISIKPTGGAARTITAATVAGSPMIDLNGADNVTIDGLNTGGNSLSIINTTVSATANTGTIRFQADATNNTITNCSILGSSTVAASSAGGNIYFANGTTTGNDGNTISNCNIGPAGSNLPAKCITFTGSSNTDPGSANSGITISNNNIYDFFLATNYSAGIDVNSGTTNITISNNRFYQTAARVQTTGVSHRPISISNANGNNYNVTGNTIGFSSSDGTGKYSFFGPSSSAVFSPIYINVGATTATSIQGNTIAGLSISGAISGSNPNIAFACINIVGGLVDIGSVTGNTIGSMTDTSSITYTSSSASVSDVAAIFRAGSNNMITNNNNIGGFTVSNSGTGATNLFGIRAPTGSTAIWTCNNNVIGGTVANSMYSKSTSTATVVHGISNPGTSGPIGNFKNNIVRNLTVAGGTGVVSAVSMVGISMANVSNDTISGNTIYNLTNTNTTAATSVAGILMYTSGTSNLVEKNLIYGLTSASNNTAAEIYGIKAGIGTTVYQNNMIILGTDASQAIGTGVTSGISGIIEVGGTNKFYHNSIYIGGTATSGAGPSFAFNSTVTTNTRIVRNNIFQNERSNNGATGKHYAVRVGGTAANPAGLTINNNIYYGTGTGFVFGYFNSTDVTSFATWKTAVGQDAGSFQSNPQFTAPTATTPDLHLSSTIASIADGNGVDVSVSNDFDGQVRSSLSPVDIGADALCFTTTSTTTQNQCGGTYTWNGQTYTTSGTYTKAFTNSKGCDSIATLVLIIRTCETTSLNFDGVNDYVSVPYKAALNPTQFTVQCWVKTPTSSSTTTVISSRDGSNGSNLKGYMLYKTDQNKWSFWVGKGTSSWSMATTTASISANTWTHLTGTYDGTTMRLYVNGVLAASTATTFSANTVYPLLIGTGANELGVGFYQFYSAMTADDIRIWNKALTQTEITNNMNCQINGAQPNLVANYQFDQGSYNVNNSTVTSLTDASGNNYNGTLTNFSLTGTSSNWVPHSFSSATSCASYVFGGTTYTSSGNYTKTLTNINGCDSIVGLSLVINPTSSSTITATSSGSYTLGGSIYTSSGTFTKVLTNSKGCDSTITLDLTITKPELSALDFDGVNDYVSIPYNAALNSAQFSVQCWVKASNSNSYAAVISNRDGSNANNTRGYTIYKTEQNKWAFWIGKGNTGNSWNTITTTSSITPDVWTQLTATYDGSTMRLYVNGVLGASGNSVFSVNTVYPFLIGTGANEAGAANYQLFAKMTMDELRVWNRALTQTEILNNMNCGLSGTQSGLVAYYQFNQGSFNANNTSVSSLADASGNNFNGVLNNFSLNGITSNWITHSVSNVVSCTPNYLWNGTNYTSNGLYKSIQTSSKGCDSTVAINLSFNQPTTSTTIVTNCGDYTWNGTTYTTSGTYTKTLTNAKGCDSVSTLNLTIYPTATVTNVSVPYSSNITPYIWNGMSFTQTTTKVLHYTNVVGCDSTATLNYKVVGGPAYSLDFNSSQSNYVTLPNGSISSKVTAGRVTVGAWVNMRSYPYNGTIISNWGDFGGGFWLLFDGTSGHLSILVGGGIRVISPNKLNLNEWHHVAFSADGQWLSLYEDGVEVGKTSYTGTINVQSATQIGALPTANGNSSLGGYWDGAICELKIWNKAMKSCQIASSMNCYPDLSDISLVAYYTFKQGIDNANNSSETTLIDSSANSINGTLRNFSLSSTTSNWTNYKPQNSFTYCQNTNIPTSSVNVNICASQLPYQYQGQTYNAAGTYNIIVPNYNGCTDSIVVLNLTTTMTEKQIKFFSKNASNNWQNYVWCKSPSYDRYVNDGDSITLCGASTLGLYLSDFYDPNIVLKKLIIDGVAVNPTYSVSAGEYFYDLQMQNADHIVEIIWGTPCTSSTTSNTNLSICSSQLPYTWNGLTFTQAGTQTATLSNANYIYCDSIATLNLFIKNNYNIIASAGANGSINSLGIDTVCAGESKTYIFTANNGYFINNVVIDGVSFGSLSTYTFSNVNANHTISVSFTQSCVANVSITNISICPNQLPYLWNGLTFTTAGTQTAHLTNICGSDSAATLNLTVNTTTSSVSDVAICSNQLPYTWNGQTLTVAGTTTVHLINIKGCDSAATLNLTVNNPSVSTTNVTATSTPFIWNNNAYNTSGTYNVTLTNSLGCDSVATLILTINIPNDTIRVTQKYCSNIPLPYYGYLLNYDHTYVTYAITGAGDYNVKLKGSKGQDSIYIITAVIIPITTINIDTGICPNNFPFIYHGNTYTTVGKYSFTIYSYQNGVCDSIFQITVYAKQSTTANINITVSGFPYIWNGSTFNTAGTYNVTLVNSVGCDSNVTLNLFVGSQITGVNITKSTNNNVCYGTPITFTATPIINTSSNAAIVIHKWLKNGQIVSSINTSISSTSTYVDSALRNTDKIECWVYATASSINLFANDSILKSNAITPSNVITPSSFPNIGFAKGVLLPAYESINTGIGENIKELSGFCSSSDSWIIKGNDPVNGIWTTDDSGIIKVSTYTAAFFGKQYRITTTGKTGMGYAKYTYNYSGCQMSLTAKIPVNTINPIPPIQITSGSNLLCVGGKINLQIADTNGIWKSNTYGFESIGNGLFRLNSYNTSNYDQPTAEYGYAIPMTTGTLQRCYRSQSISFPLQIGYSTTLATPILGTTNKLCVGSSTRLTNAATIPSEGRSAWESTAGRATVDATGNVTATSQGVANIKYTVYGYNGCGSVANYSIAVNPLPATPTLAYAPNQQIFFGGNGTPGIHLCKGQTFSIIGNPGNGVWTKTGVVTISPMGVKSSSTSLTISQTGAASITYTVTDSATGCSAARTFSFDVLNGTLVGCRAKGIKKEPANFNGEPLVIYPNPAHTAINIKLNALVGEGTLIITDLYGKQIKQQALSLGTNTINVSGFAKGIYFVSVITEQGKQTEKVLVE